MASILNPLDKEKDEEQQSGAPQQVGGAQSATLGAGTGAPAAGTKSGRFTNISNYLQANSGYNKAGGGLAGKIAGNINNQGQAVKQEVGKARDEFNTAAQQNRVGYDEGTVNNALNDSTNFAQNAQNVDKFQQQLNAKYQGPQGIQNAEKVQNNAQNLQNLTNQTTTEGGRFGLLKNMFNKPTYTGGQQKLDNLLLQGNQGQLKNLTGTRQLGNQVVNEVNTTNQKAIEEAQKYKDEAAATSQQTREQFLNSLTGFDTGLNDRANQLNIDREQMYQDALKTTGNNIVSEDDLSRFGLAKGQSLYGANLKDYLMKNNLEANSVNAATSDDYTKAAALRKLAGDTQIEGADKIFDTYAGGYNEANDINKMSAYDLDKNRLQGTLDVNKNQHDSQMAIYEKSQAEANRALNGDEQGRGGLLRAQSEVNQKIQNFIDSFKKMNGQNSIDLGQAARANPELSKLMGQQAIYQRQIDFENQKLAQNQTRFNEIKKLFGGTVNVVPQYTNIQPSEEVGTGPMIAGYTPMMGN